MHPPWRCPSQSGPLKPFRLAHFQQRGNSLSVNTPGSCSYICHQDACNWKARISAALICCFAAGVAQHMLSYTVTAAAERLQLDSYLSHSSHPVLCLTVPGKPSALPSIDEPAPLHPMLVKSQVGCLIAGLLLAGPAG